MQEPPRIGSASFEWLVTLSSTLGMAVLAAFVFSVRAVNPALEFALTWKTWVSLLVVGSLTFVGCRILIFSRTVGDGANKKGDPRRRWFLLLVVVGLGGSLASMVYLLRGTSSEKLVEVGIGASFAVVFLSILGFLFLRTIRFLNADEEENALEAPSEQR